MAEGQRPPAGAWRTYLELATGLGATSRKQVRKVVKDLVGKGNATAGQLRAMTGELLAVNTVNREALGKLVKLEVDRALGRVGLATMDVVNELTRRVRYLERQLREARTGQTASSAGRTAAAAVAASTAAPRRGRPAKTATVPASSPAVKKATRKAAKATVAAPVTATKAAKANAIKTTGTRAPAAKQARPMKAPAKKASPAKTTRRAAQ
jgi:polyhydroxyalkanoate synthesis regulator phasin